VTLLCDFIAIKACCFRYKEKNKNQWRRYVMSQKQKFVVFAMYP